MYSESESGRAESPGSVKKAPPQQMKVVGRLTTRTLPGPKVQKQKE